MNSKQRRVLAAIFATPTSPAIEWQAVEWQAIEALLLAVGCRLVEGGGSRVRFERDGVVAGFHRPHPAKDARRYQVRDAREFLTKLGVVP